MTKVKLVMTKVKLVVTKVKLVMTKVKSVMTNLVLTNLTKLVMPNMKFHHELVMTNLVMTK